MEARGLSSGSRSCSPAIFCSGGWCTDTVSRDCALPPTTRRALVAHWTEAAVAAGLLTGADRLRLGSELCGRAAESLYRACLPPHITGRHEQRAQPRDWALCE